MDLFEKKRWEVLETSHTPRVRPQGAMIYRQGETAQEFYYLKSGSVKIFISSEDGMEKTLTLLGEGRIFGEAAFFDGLPRVSSAKTLAKSEIITVTRESLMECIRRDPQFAMELLTYLSRTVRMLSAQVDSMTFLQADRRIANLLVGLASADGLVHATHEDLAALAGVSRVTVSRILSGFDKKGWIETHYGGVEVKRTDALRDFLSSANNRVSPQ